MDNLKQKKINYLVNVVTGEIKSIGGGLTSNGDDIVGKVYAPTRFNPEELPPAVDMRPFMSDVENQADSNSCTANAVVGVYEYIMKRSGVEIDFSRLFVYYNARRRENEKRRAYLEEHFPEEIDEEDEIREVMEIEDEGSSAQDTFEAIMELGICREKTWTFDTAEDDTVLRVDEKPSEESYKEAEHLKTVSRFQFEEPERVKLDLFTIKHCLAEGFPVVVLLKLFKEFDYVSYSKSARVPMPDMQDPEQREEHGSHAMLVVGYKESVEHFIVRNSWGDEWGDGGYCYIPYQYLANPVFCANAWVVTGNNAESEPKQDYSNGVWDEEDIALCPEFYEEYDSPQNQKLFSLSEAIATLCLHCAQADGMDNNEFEGFVAKILEEYDVDMNNWLPGWIEHSLAVEGSCWGADSARWAAIKIILAHKAGRKAFRIVASVAFMDGKLSREEIDFWKQLAVDLKLPEEFVTDTISTLLQENPDTVSLLLPAPLKFHSRGVAVDQLQKGLTNAGYPVKISGHFGKETKQAVRTFQKDKGLKRDCIVGQKTWDALFQDSHDTPGTGMASMIEEVMAEDDEVDVATGD